ncbi:MAG TPA: DNA helicase PcrA [Bacillota bacterium]|nr:DNA helicase PcrA [Bacillota bacterium]
MSNILDGLNPRQREAVQCTEGPLLIIAGAGSGKTKVLTSRFAYLIQEQGVRPFNILAITFTNKAAGEMRDRVERLLNEPVRDLWVSTFHSSCNRILRREIEHFPGYNSNFAIYDTADQQTVVKECLKELNLDDKKFAPRAVAGVISDAKNKLQNPDQFSRVARDYFTDKCAEVYRLYQQKLRNNNALDFDDLLGMAVRLFEENPQVLSYYQNKFKYILVDEYQDTNHAQYRLVNLLAQEHRNLCVVGDADQSIYRFRGADISNILNFQQDYPEAKTIKLEQNYRSTKVILEAANCVIENNAERPAKELWTENERGHAIVRYQGEDERREAAFVVERMYVLKDRDDREYRDFAVLYRTNAQSRVLEEELMKSRIPYKIVGGLKFYERKEIKDILSYLKVLANPSDTVAFRRIINVPKRGIGDTTTARVLDFAASEGLAPFAALERLQEIPGLTARATKPLAEFAKLMASLREKANQVSVTQLTEEILSRTGYMAELREEKTIESQTRQENLQEFLSATADFDKHSEDASLEYFLAGISLVSDVDTFDEEDNSVVLMTLHSAKGLEFPVVFLVGMEEGVFPHFRAQYDTTELEEERRLCYVGITRAKEKLYLTHAWQRSLFGKTNMNPTSRFIEEIPTELLTKVDPIDNFGQITQPSRAGSAGWGTSSWGVNELTGSYHTGSNNTGSYSSGATQASSRSASPTAGFAVPESNDMVILGDKVEHAKFGVGVVVSVKGEGPDAEISIAFPSGGVKKLIAQYAKLRKL